MQEHLVVDIGKAFFPTSNDKYHVVSLTKATQATFVCTQYAAVSICGHSGPMCFPHPVKWRDSIDAANGMSRKGA